ncbi:hypothetical protein [Aeoliella mucimassa]|uniref:DUF3592 domain-containing protein n=1 Tax=Aeoliella mucimassa TaxID=2527972 RepID=A0A518ALG7_9BACT|nr:hypothetical protein [Aeoliella mucimassa]QDU55575.1 hypothetical protein Pan181_17670 [Aeoliella mucimassa]
MAWRNPLLQKKRGGRSTGMRNLGYWSEVFLSVSLLVVGSITLALHVFQVLIPDWSDSRRPTGYEPGVCKVTTLKLYEHDTPIRLDENSIEVGEFSIEVEAARLTDDGSLPPVWLERELGHFSPTRIDALQMAELYKPGTTHACWYHPNDPSRLVLRRYVRWWVWPVTLIPLSLLGVGIWGIVASLMQVATSAERRSLVAVKAMRLDPLRESPAESSTLPAVELEDESPGTRYPYRLPVVGTQKWRMAGLMIVCALWNTLVAFLVYVATREVLNNETPWLALGVVLLLGLVGVWLAFNLIREFWERRGIGMTLLEISSHPLALGGTYRVYLLQGGWMHLRWLTVELVCEESASFRQGTDLRTSVEQVFREELRKWQQLHIEPTLPFEADLTVTIPEWAMHSFRSSHNEVRWMLLVKGETMRRQEVYRQFALNVRPAIQVKSDEDLAGTAPGTSGEALV